MKNGYLNRILVLLLLAALPLVVTASNLANPAAAFPEGRIAVGASYHLGGYTITNKNVPALFNRFCGRVEFAPLKYLAFGADLGAIQIDVDRYIVPGKQDTIPVFHGNYGFSGGGHLKLATPAFAHDIISFVAITQATLFNSSNSHGASYGGKDGVGAVGMQFHIPHFGYITAGPWVYLIRGENKSFNGKTGTYSNSNNVRGWMAIDFFPNLHEVSNNTPYFSLEFSISPEADYSKRLPVQEFSISLSIGSITGRLFGVESSVPWKP